MPAAGLVPSRELNLSRPGRNDRPLEVNSVVVWFRLRKAPTVVQPLFVYAPAGFQFNADCSEELFVARAMVFGSIVERYAEWPVFAEPLSCAGEGRLATILVPVGLLNDTNYALRISVRNPIATPTFNTWRVEFNAEASVPFPGFALNFQPMLSARIVSHLALAARNDRASALNRVTLSFALASTPSERLGFFVHAPVGYAFDEDCLLGINVSVAAILPQTSSWPTEGEPYKCFGEDRTAQLILPIGLQRNRTYAFSIEVRNAESTPNWNKWYFEYNRESSPPVAGFPLTFNTMVASGWAPASAAVLQATFRDDRPRMQNNVILWFELASTPTEEQTLYLHAPDGFKFEKDCLSSVEVHEERVFGPDTWHVHAPLYAFWPNS
jgi:hypothetical protein